MVHRIYFDNAARHASPNRESNARIESPVPEPEPVVVQQLEVGVIRVHFDVHQRQPEGLFLVVGEADEAVVFVFGHLAGIDQRDHRDQGDALSNAGEVAGVVRGERQGKLGGQILVVAAQPAALHARQRTARNSQGRSDTAFPVVGLFWFHYWLSWIRRGVAGRVLRFLIERGRQVSLAEAGGDGDDHLAAVFGLGGHARRGGHVRPGADARQDAFLAGQSSRPGERLFVGDRFHAAKAASCRGSWE